MSMGGIIAAGLAGGANAVGNITAGMIDQERRLQSAQALSDIDEQKQLRIVERLNQMDRDNEEYNTVGKGADNALKFAERKGGVDLTLKRNEATDPTLRKAKVDDATAEATAKHDLDRKFAVADANDPVYIGAVTKLKLADPEVAQRIAASRAQIAASGASVGLIQAQTEGVKIANADKKALDKLYADAVAILSDATIDDAERARRYTKVSQQIVLMKSKNGQPSARDPELDTTTIKETKIDAEGNTIETTRKEARRPGSGGGAARPTEEQAHAEALAAIKQGKPADAINARLVELGYKPLPAAPTAQAGSQPQEADPLPARTEYLRELGVLEQMRKKGPSPTRERDIAAQEAKVNRLLELAR